MSEYSDVVETARSYYNSEDADNFYFNVWGGEDIHIGLYKDEQEPIRDASRRTVAELADRLETAGPDSEVIDLGGAYGGSPRYVAQQYGCHVVSLNLSEVQNRRARQQNEEYGMADKVTVVDGDFENVPYDDNSFDIVWSQDSFLHSGNRLAVLKEIQRVLKPGGELLFTDPMQEDNIPQDAEKLQPVLKRLSLDTLGSPGFYQEELAKLGFENIEFDDKSDQLPRHYGRVREELLSRYDELTGTQIGKDYVDSMLEGLAAWVDAGKAGLLRWGFIHARLKK